MRIFKPVLTLFLAALTFSGCECDRAKEIRDDVLGVYHAMLAEGTRGEPVLHDCLGLYRYGLGSYRVRLVKASRELYKHSKKTTNPTLRLLSFRISTLTRKIDELCEMQVGMDPFSERAEVLRKKQLEIAAYIEKEVAYYGQHAIAGVCGDDELFRPSAGVAELGGAKNVEVGSSLPAATSKTPKAKAIF